MTARQPDWGSFSQALAALRPTGEKRRVALFAHVNPDGDSLGSCLALAAALQYGGDETTVIVEKSFPAVFNYLAGSEHIVSLAQVGQRQFDLAVLPDIANPERLGESLALANNIPQWVNIDHHRSNPGFGAARWVDPQRSSVGEMALELLWGLGVPIDGAMAEAVYTAMMTDTGAFRYESATARVYRYAAYLLDRGARPAHVSHHVYDSMPLTTFRLLVAALQGMQLELDGQVAYMVVTQEMLAATGAQASELEGLINYARRLAGVEVAILFLEQEQGTIRISLRAKQWADVGHAAAQLGGGGHPRAAGATLPGPVEKAVPQALAAVQQALQAPAG